MPAITTCGAAPEPVDSEPAIRAVAKPKAAADASGPVGADALSGEVRVTEAARASAGAAVASVAPDSAATAAAAVGAECLREWW